MVIDTLQLDIIVDNKGATQRINNTTKALKSLHNTINQINASGGVNGALNGAGGGGSKSSGGGNIAGAAASGGKFGWIGAIVGAASELKRTLNLAHMAGQLYFIKNITQQIGQELAKIVQYGMDYEETLNLWQTAMRGNIAQARIFTSELTKAYGISEATLMTHQATFKNMLSALGNINEDTAYVVSEAMTQMALDFASLYNTSVESAMTKFQAVLAGQVRPIRTAGYDITENTIFQLYQDLGGTKTVRQLNQTEKQLLRILAVYKQMEKSGATGDLAKTIRSSANQVRIMKEQIKEFATWIGVGFNTLIEKSGILIEINGWLYAGVALAKQFAKFLGYTEKDYSISWEEDIEGAEKEYEKFKNKLLGFDKFQSLKSGEDDGNELDISQEVLDALSKYDEIFNNVDNPALERAKDLLSLIGITLDENGNIVGGFESLVENAKTFAKVLGTCLFFIGLFTNPFLAIGAAIEYVYLTNENFRNSLKEIGAEIMPQIQEIMDALAPMWDTIADFVLDVVEALLPLLPPIIDIMKNLAPTFVHAFQVLLPLISTIISIIADLVRPILEIIERISALLGLIHPFVITLASIVLTFVSGVFEFIGKIAETIFTIVEKLAHLDFTSIIKSVQGIWATWNTDRMVTATETSGNLVTEILNKVFPAEAHANGGLATKGSLFYAGEAGPELVTQTSGGGSTIMNMKQLEDAVARGFIRGFASTDNAYDDSNSTDVYVDGQRLFNIMRNTAKRNGYDFVRV